MTTIDRLILVQISYQQLIVRLISESRCHIIHAMHAYVRTVYHLYRADRDNGDAGSGHCSKIKKSRPNFQPHGFRTGGAYKNYFLTNCLWRVRYRRTMMLGVLQNWWIHFKHSIKFQRPSKNKKRFGETFFVKLIRVKILNGPRSIFHFCCSTLLQCRVVLLIAFIVQLFHEWFRPWTNGDAFIFLTTRKQFILNYQV